MLRLSSVGELELWHVRMFYMDIYLIRCQAVIIQSESTLEFQFRIFGTAIYHDKYMIRDVHVVNDFVWFYNQKMSYVKTFYHPKYETSNVTWLAGRIDFVWFFWQNFGKFDVSKWHIAIHFHAIHNINPCHPGKLMHGSAWADRGCSIWKNGSESDPTWLKIGFFFSKIAQKVI